MNEKQLQAKIVMWFSQTYPQYRGLLFEVNNDTANVKHAMSRRAVGMIAGVSDLLFISPIDGTANGIELKAPNTRHTTSHLLQQLEWGKTIVNVGSSYIMSCEIEQIKQFITNILRGKKQIYIVPPIIESQKTNLIR